MYIYMNKDKRQISRGKAGGEEPATVEVSLSLADNIRLIAGFILMLLGAFIFFSVVSYFFYWKSDMSSLAELGRPMSTPDFNNVCGKGGARVASYLVGEGFGIFALVIPVVLSIVGWRLFRPPWAPPL